VLLLLLLGLLLPEPKGVGVAVTRGSLHVTFLPTNKVEIFGQVSKALPPFLFLSLFLSLLKLLKKKKTKQKRCSAALARVAVCCWPSPRVIVLPAQRRELECCWPLPQQRVTTRCQLRHRSELQRSVGLAIVANCNALLALPQHCVARSCSVVLPPAIAAVAAELCSFNVRPTSVQLPSNVCPTSVRRPTNFRPTSGQLPSVGPASCCPAVLLPYALRLVVLRPTYCRPAP